MSNTLKRLSKITGITVLKIKELLNLNLVLDDNYKLSSKDIEELGRSLYECPNYPLARLIMLVDGVAYRGTVLGSDKRGRFVVYSDDSGKRHSKIIECNHHYFGNLPASYYYVESSRPIYVYPIAINELNDFENFPSVSDSFEMVSKCEEISICKNEDGYFLLDSQNKRISNYYANIQYDSVGVFIVENFGLYGLVDKLGHVLMTPRYLEMSKFSDGLAAVLDYDRWGYINVSGEVIIKPIYTSVSPFCDGFAEVTINNSESGHINTKGNAVINRKVVIEFPEYSLVRECNGGYYCYAKNTVSLSDSRIPIGATILNKDIECILQNPNYEFRSLCYLGNCFIAEKDDYLILYSKCGNIFHKVETCHVLDGCNKFIGCKEIFGKDRIEIGKSPTKRLFVVSQNSKKGVIDCDGSIIIPFEYEQIGYLSSQALLAWDGRYMRLYSISGDYHSELYDLILKNEELVKEKETQCFYVYRNNKVGLLLDQKLVFPCVYDHIEYSYFSTYKNENKHVGRFIIDGISIDHDPVGADGNYVKKPKDYTWMSDYSYYGLAIALKDELFGIIDSNFNIVKEFQYDTILKVDSSHYVLSKNNQIQLVRFDKEHNEVMLETHIGSVVSRLDSSIFRYIRDGKYGVFKYNPDKEIFDTIVKCDYDNIYEIDRTFIIVMKDGLMGCYSSNGELLLDIKYKSIVSPVRTQDRFEKEIPNELLLYNNLIAYLSDDENCVKITNRHWFSKDMQADIYSLRSKQAMRCNFNEMEACYFDHDRRSLGAFIKLKNKNNELYIAPLDCKTLLGPFDSIKSLWKGTGSHKSYWGLQTTYKGKIGFIDYETFDSIPCEYENPVRFASPNHRYYLLNCDCESKVIYDSLKKENLKFGSDVLDVEFIDDLIKVKVLDNHTHYEETEKTGVFDSDFNTIVPIKYKTIKKGYDGQFIVIDDHGRYGIVDDRARCIYPFSSGRITYTGWSSLKYNFYDQDDNLYAESEDGYSIVDVQDDSSSKRTFIPDSTSHYILEYTGSGLLTVCTAYGEIITNIRRTTTFEDNVTIIHSDEGNYVINKVKRLTTNSHERITINKRRKYITLKDGNTRQFIDFDGNILGEIEGKFENCLLYKEAGVVVCMIYEEGGIYYQIYSLAGELLNDSKFSYIGSFNENYAVCVTDSHVAINEKFFRDAKKETFLFFKRRNYGKWGIMNNLGEIVAPMRFDYIRPVKNGLAIYGKDRGYGIINLKNKVRTPPRFKYIFSYSEGLCAFREFEEGELFYGNSYSYSNCGFIDEEGHIVIPALYHKVTKFENGIAAVYSKNNRSNHIDNHGNLLHEWEIVYDDNDNRYDSYDDGWFGYTSEELEEMYRDAMGGDPTNEWNID